MNNIEITLIVLVLSLLAGGLMIYFRSSRNLQGFFQNADKIVSIGNSVLDVASNMLPDNKVINVLEIIDKYAKIGVKSAEQLYLSSKLDKDSRLETAKNTVYSVLKQANINITDEVKSIVNGAIEAEVLALGHAPKDVQVLENDKSKLQQENEELKSKLANIKASI